MSKALAAPRIGPPGIRNPAGFRDPGEIVAALRNDPDALLFYDAADSRYDGGQIPFDAAYRHFDGYLGSLWPANIAPAGYDPTTDLSVTVVDGEADHLQSDLTTTPSGDFDVRIKCAAADWQSAGANYLVTQWTSTGSQRAVTLYRSASSLAMLYSINGSGSEAALAVPSSTSGLTNGEAYWLRWVYTSATATLETFTSVDGVSWTSHGTDTNAVAHTLFDSSAGWEVCGLNGAQNITTDTTVYAVEVIDGSTTIIDLDFTRDAKAGETASVTDLTGNTWTFNGTLEVTDENGLTPNTKALRLPGVTGNYVSTPDTSEPATDFDCRVLVALDDWSPATNQQLLTKRTAAGTGSFLFYVDTNGYLHMALSDDGGTSFDFRNSAVATGFADGTPHHVRVTYRQSDGRVQFFTSEDGSSWTQLGTDKTSTATGFGSSASQWGIGQVSYGGGEPVSGLIFSVVFYEDLTETSSILDVDFDRDAGLYDTSFTGGDGLTYTVNQSAATTNDPLVFGAGANADYSFTGTKYVYLPATAGNVLSTPDAAALDITGDIDVRAHVLSDDWTSGAWQTVAGKWSGSNKSWRVRISATGYLEFWASTDGAANTVAVTSTVDVTGVVADGADIWLRWTYDVSTGDVDFYTSSDGVSWSQLGATVSATGAAIFSGSADVQVGYDQFGGNQFGPGLIYAVEVYDGIAGTKVVDLDVNRDTIAADHSTITDAKGNVWTVNRSAAPSFQTSIIDRPCWLFGADCFIQLPQSSDWDVEDGQGKTFVIGFRPYDAEQYGRVLDARNASGNKPWTILRDNLTDVWLGDFRDGTNNNFPKTGTVTWGKAQVLSVRVDDSFFTARLDGTDGTPVARTYTVDTNEDGFRIGLSSQNVGSESDSVFWFLGIFDRALTEAELQALEAVYG